MPKLKGQEEKDGCKEKKKTSLYKRNITYANTIGKLDFFF